MTRCILIYLIPDTLSEMVNRTQIWQNAFSKVPRALSNPYHGPTDIYFVQAGDTIDNVCGYMFPSGPYRTMSNSNKRALLIHNNPFLENHLGTGTLPMNMLLNITPVMLSEMDQQHWNLQQTPLKTALNQMEGQLREMFKQVGPEPTLSMAQIVEELKAIDVSKGAKKTVTGVGYGVGGISGYAAAGAMSVDTIKGLMRELHTEAIQKYGKKVVNKANASNMRRMQSFLEPHPKHRQLMRHLKELPKHLLPKGGFSTGGTGVKYPAARNFHRHVSLPLKKWSNPSLYVDRMAKQLNGKVSRLKLLGRGATWYVPALLGIASVAVAPPEERVRTAFEDGFGVLGGALGTTAGSMAGGFIAISILGLGPLGWFVAVFVCASIVGIAGMELFKKGGGQLYDSMVPIGNGQIFNSPEQLIIKVLK